MKLAAIDRFLKRIHLLSRKRASVSIALAAIVWALSASQMPRLAQTVSLEDQLDPSMQSTRDLRELGRLFPAQPGLDLILLPENGKEFTEAELCRLRAWLDDFKKRKDLVSDVSSPFDLRQARFDEERILSYPRLLAADCADRAEGTGALGRLLESPWRGIVTSRDGADLLIRLSPRRLEKPGAWGTFDPGVVRAIMTAVESEVHAAHHWTGTAALEYYTSVGMEKTRVLNAVVVAIIWIMMRVLFGTWLSGLVYMTTLGFTSVLVYGGMARAGHPVDLLAVSLFLLILVASLEDFIFLSYHQLEHRGQGGFWALITPSFFTSLTTAMGFGSLMLSSLSAIRRFGLWAAVGTLIEWFAIFILLPAVQRKLPALRSWVRPEKALFRRFSLRLLDWVPPRPFVIASLLVFVLSVKLVPGIRMSQSPSKVFPPDHPFQRSIDHLERTRGWSAEASLLFSSELDPARRAEILAQFRKEPVVAAMDEAAGALSFVREKIVPEPVRNVVRWDFKFSPFADRYFNGEQERAILYLATSDTASINALRARAAAICPASECRLAGIFIAYADFSRNLIVTLFESLLMSLLMVGATLVYLCLSFGKWRAIPAVLISSGWGVAGMMTWTSVMKTPVNFITCIVAGLVVGLAGDNAIQYLFASRGGPMERGVRARGTGSIQCAILMMLCCLGFLGSYFEPPKELGVLLACSFFLSLVGDVWVLKGLLAFSRKGP